MTALCLYHMQAKYWKCEISRKRLAWHVLKDIDVKCKCVCAFCSWEGCNHGKNPAGGSCLLWSCNRCKEVKCPCEWTASGPKTVWYNQKPQGKTWWRQSHGAQGTRHHQDRNDAEMGDWNESISWAWWQSSVDQVKGWLVEAQPAVWRCADQGGFYSEHKSFWGKEADTAYYNKRQTLFFMFVVWYHTENSTEESPKIAM